MPPAPFKIVVAEPLADPALERLRQAGDVLQPSGCTESDLLECVPDCDALVVRSYAPVTRAVIAAARRLKVIGRAGIGVENIDVAAAVQAGVVVVHTPAASTQAVAEMTLGLIVMLERRLHWSEQMLRRGAFLEARREPGGRQLCDLTLGIIGLGRIGSRVAEIAHRGFGMGILYNDIRTPRSLPCPARAVSKEYIYGHADVISLHVPLTRRTRRMIDPDALARMTSSTRLINTSRGGVVDGPALADALHHGRPAGAALDVFDPEPPDPEDPLLLAPNCIVTPHIGSRTAAALLAMNDVVEDVLAVLRGQPPNHAFSEDPREEGG